MSSSRHEPFLIEVDPLDEGYEESKITKVKPYSSGDGWEIAMDSGFSLGLPRLTHARYGGDPAWTSPEPKVGDTIRTYGSFGRPIRGITLNGAVVFYRTPALQEASHRRMVEDMDAASARQFTLDRVKMDADYEQLIPEFRARVDRLRAADPEFRVQAEAYEVFILLQAQAVAEHYRALAAAARLPMTALALFDVDRGPRGDGSDSFRAFNDLWGKLTDASVLSDSHSNNTAAAAFAFARTILDGTSAENETKAAAS